MNVYSILKDGLRGEGSDKMWCITKILSDCIEEYLPEKQREELLNKVYYSVNGGHFNRESADIVIPKMYYVNRSKSKCYAPYWTESEVKSLYEKVRHRIPAYNFYDFEVTLNMVKSDTYSLLESWFPEATEEDIDEKILDGAVNYLDDEDNPYGTEKVWKYLNG